MITHREFSVIHAVVECQDCDWETCSYKNAQALASRHANAHGHRVIGELGIYIEYVGKKKEDSNA